MTIYVGNLNFQASEEDLKELFSPYVEVESVNIIKDKFSGRAKGFAFVEVSDESAGNKAIEALNETDFMERNIVVNKARPKTEGDRPRGGGGGGGGWNRGGGGGGGDRGGRGGGDRDRNRGGGGGGYGRY